MTNFDYQKKAFEKLSKLRAGILFMSMGTGKTKVAMDLAISRQDSYDCIIWIAPASLINSQSYVGEINKWSKNLIKPIKFYSIESIGGSDRLYLELINLAKEKRTFCVVDESLTIKNLIAKRTKRLLENWHLFNFRLILNGTPITKSLLDIYSQVQFIHPNILKMTETQFANNFLSYKKDGYRSYAKSSRPANEEALIEIIKPYIFDSKLEINCGINNIEINCKMNFDEKENYANLKNHIFSKTDFELDFFSVSQQLQHFYTKNCQEKYQELDNIINKISDKLIIYVKYIDELNFIKQKYNAVEYSGRDKTGIELFKKNNNILISTYGSGSLGHNLQFCNNIVYFTQTFDYKDKEQSLHRIYRVGQTKDCNIYNFYVNTGLEDMIKISLKKKICVLSALKDFIRKNKIEKL